MLQIRGSGPNSNKIIITQCCSRRTRSFVRSMWTPLLCQNNQASETVVEALEAADLTDFVNFRHDWNEEIIMQFYATLYLQGDMDNLSELMMYWMTAERQYRCKYSTFLQLIGHGLDGDSAEDRISDEEVSSNTDLACLYPVNFEDTSGATKTMTFGARTLNKIMRVTFAPKSGNQDQAEVS